jgi:DNA-binding MarR family transcriptional regulator
MSYERAARSAGGRAPSAAELAEVAGSARVERGEEQARQAENKEPLRRRLLEALAEEAATPSELAVLLGAANESVSRLLKDLYAEELVEIHGVEGDRRVRLYVLTAEGEVRLSKERVFGEPLVAPARPTDQDTLALLWGGLDNAVRMRREANALDAAVDRLLVVLERARALGAYDLELEAIAELVTTLRQARGIDAMWELLEDLKEIALGRHESREPALALPAAAHLEYTLGRLPEMHGGEDACARARHLDAAQTLYALAHSSDVDRKSAWLTREAWSVVSLASNLRERSKLEDALEKSEWAMSLFERLGDPYGRSRCLFMYGFCQRLMGHFDSAWQHLGAAHELAEQHGYQRFQADSLVQMGEVLRCKGEIEEAHELLTDAVARAERMGLLVTQAFAQSALGAVAYEQERLGDGQAAMVRAGKLFSECRHEEGHALNERRQAVLERRLLEERAGGEMHAGRRFALCALARYQRFRSPAGMVACEIEGARLERIAGGEVSGRIARLIERLDDTRQLGLLELDPWVPTVFCQFAKEVGDGKLGELAQYLMNSSRQRLARVSGRASGAAAGLIEGARKQFGEPGYVGCDMGGEARSEEDAICRLAMAA